MNHTINSMNEPIEKAVRTLATPPRFGKHACVYTILNSVTGERYVGSTANLRRRATNHRSLLRRGIHDNRLLQQAADTHGLDALKIEVLEYLVAPTPRSERLEREQYYLDSLMPAYNLSPHADSCLGVKHTPTTRANASAIRRDPAYSRMMSAKMRGRTFSEETRAKMRIAHLGKSLPPERRAQMSEVRRGKTKSPEHVAKVAAALRGRTISAETRAKQSEAQRRRFARPDERTRNLERLANARAIRWDTQKGAQRAND